MNETLLCIVKKSRGEKAAAAAGIRIAIFY
jgi:hypothetical protein